MPARRRSKVGETRKDAALDAMRPFGFPDNLTRTTLSQLLKVYGKDGWAFIEDNGYRVLTEAILEAIEQKQPDQDGKDVGHQPDQENDTQVLADQHNLILNHPCQDEEASVEKKDFAQHIYESEEEPTDEALIAVKKCLVHQVIVPCKKCTSDAIKAIRCVDMPRRKPCFGWISDSEDDGLVTLARSDQ